MTDLQTSTAAAATVVPLKPKPAKACDWLDKYHGDRPRHLVAIHDSRKGDIVGKRFDPGQRHECEQWLTAMNRDHYGIYFYPNVLRADFHGVKAAKTDVAQAICVHCEVDPADDADLTTADGRRREKDRILGSLTFDLPPGVPDPSRIIDSGNGGQAIYLLDKAVSIDGDVVKAEEFERYNRQLVAQLGGDPNSVDVSRVLRTPHLINWPSETKRKAGKVPVLAGEIEAVGGTHSLAAFQKAALDGTGKANGTAKPKRARSVKSAPLVKSAPVTDLAILNEYGVDDRIKGIIEEGKDFDHPKATDNSDSAWTFDVLCNLARASVPEGLVLSIVTDPSWAISAHLLREPDPDKSARRQIAKARAKVDADGLVLHASSPVVSARTFKELVRPDLVFMQGDLWTWDGSAYRIFTDAAARHEIQGFLEGARTLGAKDAVVPFNPTSSKVKEVFEGLRAAYYRPTENRTPPYWIDPEPDDPDPKRVLSFPNGLLNVTTGELLPQTPRYFTRHAVPFDYDPDAPEPERFLKLIEEHWGDGPEGALLQEIFGYLVLPDTSQQKIFLLKGPPRSSKGTLADVLKGLIGHANVAGTRLQDLGREFGLMGLRDKSVAIVSDMQLAPNANTSTIAQNLKRISGEDLVEICVKYREPVQARLQVRFLILSNEMPAILDPSGALANRLVPIHMGHSVLGREDPNLGEKLAAEIQGIMNWALIGRRRLDERGHFDLPESSRDMVAEAETSAAPVQAFLESECDFDPAARTAKTDVYDRYVKWCDRNREIPSHASRFGCDLLNARIAQNRVTATRRRVEGDRVYYYLGLKLLPEPEPFEFVTPTEQPLAVKSNGALGVDND